MSTEIERYRPGALAPVQDGLSEVDSWVRVITQIGELASKIANTDFVPESMRGKTAAVAAAMLAGREMGIGPMTALQNIHVIKGKPGQSAQLMRSLVLAKGHDIRFVETNDTRCVVEGRRRGEEDWQRVSFTADQAKRAKIDLGGYPEDKLVARATARLCRRKFADCLAGMPYTVEELEDGELDGPALGPATEAPAPEQPAQRTARRRTTPAKSRAAAQPAPAAEQTASTATPEPGFDGDQPDTRPTGHDEPITSAQMTKLQAIFTEHGLGERDTRLRICSQLIERDLSSANDLTKAEAVTLIDALENLASTGNLTEVVTEMLADAGSTDQIAADGDEQKLFDSNEKEK